MTHLPPSPPQPTARARPVAGLKQIAGGSRIGPFRVDATGRIDPAEPDCATSFRFRWRGHAMQAGLGQGGLELDARLGQVPSTAGHEDARPGAFAALRFLARAMPADWRLRLAPDHSVRLSRSLAVPMPTSAVDLLADLTCFLLALAPYLDLLDEAGLGGADADGTANTCPG